MAKKFDFEKERKELDYKYNLLEALLVSSVSEDNFRLPTIKESILSEVVNGTIKYTGGGAGKINYQQFRLEHNFERDIYRYFQSEMKSPKRKLNPKIRNAIDKLCENHLVNPDGPDRPYWNTQLYSYFTGFVGLTNGICPVIMRSSFSLSQENILRTKKFLQSLSDSEKRDILGIGKSMRKYIDEDLKFIGKTILW